MSPPPDDDGDDDAFTSFSAWVVFKSLLQKVKVFTDPELVELPPVVPAEEVDDDSMMRFEFVEFELGFVAGAT